MRNLRCALFKFGKFEEWKNLRGMDHRSGYDYSTIGSHSVDRIFFSLLTHTALDRARDETSRCRRKGRRLTLSILGSHVGTIS